MTAPRPLRGRKLGDRRVVVDRPHSAYFRYAGPGIMVAKAAASAPTTATGRALARFRSVLFGRPLASEQEIEELLPKKKALAIFSSDAISSSAYATDEILKALILAGVAALALSIYIAAAIAVLLAIVAFSYRQVCRAYPSGGGAYVVARENLGSRFGLIAAAALMIDYVMTVAVSTASALENLGSAWPAVADFKVELAALAIALVTIANLRGIRESGNIFALPTYLFIGMTLLAIGSGIANVLAGTAHHLAPPPHAIAPGTEVLTLVLIGHAFASGSVALTGTEAIANGVPAFKRPSEKNAADTLLAMALLLGTLFIGLTFVALQYGIQPAGNQGPTVLGQVGATVFGDSSILFYVLQASAALILFLAANTSFNAFPRLAAILAQDGYMPRQFAFRGDRLAFSWGIVALAGFAILILAIFRADTHALIPLYSVGVFICFTLSQVGMVRHWRAERSAGWAWRGSVNGFGALLTGIVFVVVAYEKFRDGAWLVLVLIPVIIAAMTFINHQYTSVSRQLTIRPGAAIPGPHRHNTAIIPVPGVNRATVQALNVARSLTKDIRAVYVSDSPEAGDEMRTAWNDAVPDVPLVLVESPYRALVAPFVAYLDVVDRAWPAEKEKPITFVLIPEYIGRSWWERLLYNQAAKQLRAALLGRPHTIVINIPYKRDEPRPETHEAEEPTGTLLAGDETGHAG